ncbi:putative F-box/FBD/LRR-repeat protein At4g03220 isoform X2 [Andrographis paniculata]|uniref:putative F-box/FBD/LRR-repeat protein At4g03220 isoform X2 n=1 Tax=Andrographis paniculata TaxID=175694 RepID=UPI0021E7E544|nr:putative F-box/FBD/LRR-repeat protein At4g03220 isoform X2 [Andrographis paniculata]
METRSAKRKKLLLLNEAQSQQQQQQVSPISPPPPHPQRDEDRISDLPDDIIHRIFFFLPIKSIARMGVLSKRWNHLWNSFPHLDFTTVENAESSLSIFARKKTSPRSSNSYLSYVDQILDLLQKHSDMRVLKFRGFLTFSKLSCLVRQAVKHNLQELDLEVSTSDYFNFPRSIITCGSLRVLRLRALHPGFRLPHLQIVKDGFQSLTSLCLCRPVFHDRPSLLDLFTSSSFPLLKKLGLEACFGLKHLRIECPALEDLCLESCFQLEDLEISVQKLHRLRVSSCFTTYSSSCWVKINAPALEILLWSYNSVTDECSLHNLTRLREVFIGFFLVSDNLSAAKMTSVLKFLTGVSSCRSLTVESHCIQILSKHSLFLEGSALCPFKDLKSLDLTTSSFSKHDTAAMAALFRNAPAVHTLSIRILSNQRVEGRGQQQQQWNKELWGEPGEEGYSYWESQLEWLREFFESLKVVRIHGFSGVCGNNVSLVKFLLKHGKALEEVLIAGGGGVAALPKRTSRRGGGRRRSRSLLLLRHKIRSQIMALSRASSHAKIVFR